MGHEYFWPLKTLFSLHTHTHVQRQKCLGFVCMCIIQNINSKNIISIQI
jgi:hypothetical protein